MTRYLPLVSIFGLFVAGGCTEEKSVEAAPAKGPAELDPPRRVMTVRALTDDVWRADLTIDGEQKVPRREIRKFGSAELALVGDGTRTYTYYLFVEPDTELTFSVGADAPTRFELRATADGSPTAVLYEEKVEAGPWTRKRVSLARFAKQAIRLELATRGAGRSAWGRPRLVRPGPAPDIPVVTDRNAAKNVVMIVIDTARQDAYSSFAPDSRVETPAMVRLARDSTIFTNASANAPWTKPTVASILTGLYASTHRAIQKSSVLSKKARLLSEHLHGNGFETAIFSANGYVSKRFGFGRGWDTYVNFIRENKDHDAENVYAAATKWLEKRDESKRFFLYIQTIDPHVPLAAPDEDLGRYWEGAPPKKIGEEFSGEESFEVRRGRMKLDDRELDYVRALYNAEVTYHDRYMGKFIDELRTRDLLDDSLLIITADHGEELMDHGKIGHGHSLYEELIRVPLVVRLPGLFSGGRVSTPVSQVDILPTVLATLRVAPMKHVQGAPLFGASVERPMLRPAYTIAEFQEHSRSIRLGTYKRITGKHPGLFDLEKDPKELTDLSKTHPIAARTLERYAAEAQRVPSKRARIVGRRGPSDLEIESTAVMMDPELEAQLRALGYFATE